LKNLCLLALIFFVLAAPESVSQTSVARKPREYKRIFQLAFFPGISTNGISSGSYTNDFSINLFGGLSAGNRIFELGLISNAELNSVSGIQMGGLANIVGANTFLNLSIAGERELEQAGFESNQKGIQLAGLINYVRINSKGIQISSGFNSVGYDFTGVQLAGLGNRSGQAQGFQIAGFYNVAEDGMGGVQISSLMNYTRGQLAGMQISLVNKALLIKGSKSSAASNNRGLQIGLVNFCREMDGTQIGIINIGGQMRGRQIGLINIFRKTPPKENIYNGLPIGLLNFGSAGTYVRLSNNELYSLNLEITTGNCANCSWVMGSNMPFKDSWKKYNQNAIVLGYDRMENTWGFGYGFQRILFNKFTVSPQNAAEAKLNERKMLSFGLKFMHLNRDMKLDQHFNMLSRLNLEYGIRMKVCHVFAGIAFNYFLQDPNLPLDTYRVRSVSASGGKLFGFNALLWPGYSVGLHF
jgi:hypothetical protein